MKGFIRQRGEAWELRVYLGADPVTGKQRYSTRTVRADKREAQRVLNEMITEAERGLAVRRNATVGELLEAWFEMASGDFSPSTVKETRGFIDRNLLPTLGAVPLSKLRASELDAFYRRLQASGGFGRPTAVTRHRAANPRHPAAGAGAGSEVGLDGREPRRLHVAAACTAARDQAAVERGAGQSAAPCRRRVARAGVLPARRRCHGCSPLGGGGAALARRGVR
jgi:hypothetical protein